MSRMEWIKIYFNAENYLYRLFGIIIVLILVGIGLRNWLEYRTLEQEISDTAYREAKLMQEYFVSARYVYHQQFIQSGIELNHETIGFLPAHAASRISDEFQTRTSQAITVRNVSDHARNPKNAPMPYERIAIESFKRDGNQSEVFTQIRHGGREYFFYAMPLRIEPYCMMCHGKREDAPTYIRDTYTNGYNYHVGDVRGITSITIEKNGVMKNSGG